ncbi:MAG: hypothetical protein F4007_03505 [Chloroflexi bacterium]|nr:hypothetical protein [Chloroflexota bacterium]
MNNSSRFTSRGRMGRRIAALAALLGAALLLWSTLPVGAQTGATLVSNLGQTIRAYGQNHRDNIQAFTTGGHADGYTLTSVSLTFNVQDADANRLLGYEVEIWRTDAEGAPSSRVATLLKPSALVNGTNTFNAPGSGVYLVARTTYAVYWNVTRRDAGLNNDVVRLAETSNLAETGASGWSIANTNIQQPWNAAVGSGWTRFLNVSFLLSISGREGGAPVVATAPRPDPANLARSDVQWGPDGGVHPIPTRRSEISLNRPKDASGQIDLSPIAASVPAERQRHSRGFYVTTLVESPHNQPHLLRRLDYDRAPGSPLLKVRIWHVYYHADRGTNTVELLGDIFVGRSADRLTAPVEICLSPPREADPERIGLAVKGRLDPSWTILATTVEGGLVCAETTRVAWLTLVEARDEAA